MQPVHLHGLRYSALVEFSSRQGLWYKVEDVIFKKGKQVAFKYGRHLTHARISTYEEGALS